MKCYLSSNEEVLPGSRVMLDGSWEGRDGRRRWVNLWFHQKNVHVECVGDWERIRICRRGERHVLVIGKHIFFDCGRCFESWYLGIEWNTSVALETDFEPHLLTIAWCLFPFLCVTSSLTSCGVLSLLDVAPHDSVRPPQRLRVIGRIPAAPLVVAGIYSSTHCDPNWMITTTQHGWNESSMAEWAWTVLLSTPNETKLLLSESFVYSNAEDDRSCMWQHCLGRK